MEKNFIAVARKRGFSAFFTCFLGASAANLTKFHSISVSEKHLSKVVGPPHPTADLVPFLTRSPGSRRYVPTVRLSFHLPPINLSA